MTTLAKAMVEREKPTIDAYANQYYANFIEQLNARTNLYWYNNFKYLVVVNNKISNRTYDRFIFNMYNDVSVLKQCDAGTEVYVFLDKQCELFTKLSEKFSKDGFKLLEITANDAHKQATTGNTDVEVIYLEIND